MLVEVRGEWEYYSGGGSILKVWDVYSRTTDVTADDTAKLFFKNVVKYWGVPHVIVSDRDPRFTGRFWTANQHDWAKLLDVAQFSYNMQRSEATGKSPFELVTRRQRLTPNALAASYEGSSPAAYKTMKECHEQANMARASLDKAAKRMKWADERRRHVEFEVEDQVMVKLLPQQFKSLRKVHKGLIRRYEGLFPMIGRIKKVSYRVQLPPKLKIHPVFHVSFLKPYHGDEEDPERGVSKRAPTAVVTSYDREQVGKRKTYYGSLRTRSRDIMKMARRRRRELRWGRMSHPTRFNEVSWDSGLVLHLTRRLSGILWKVKECLGSP
nr:hypothetical protein CTI12_AA187700 [Tanacetum cinerariifolium]